MMSPNELRAIVERVAEYAAEFRRLTVQLAGENMREGWIERAWRQEEQNRIVLDPPGNLIEELRCADEKLRRYRSARERGFGCPGQEYDLCNGKHRWEDEGGR